jgi:hypothetical protein
VEQRKQGRGWHQHFLGSWARLNCEYMPVIPAWLVRSNFNDPRRVPYLLVWKDERHDGKCVAHDSWGHVELKRTDKSITALRIVWQMLAGRLSSCFVRTATDRAVMSTAGNGISFQGARTWSVASVGDTTHAPGCATLPRAAICAPA